MFTINEEYKILRQLNQILANQKEIIARLDEIEGDS